MKKFALICLLTVIIFVILTLSTASLQRKVDGNDIFGFPAAFYIRYGGMVSPAPTTEMTRFILLNLVLDIVAASIIAMLFFGIYPKIKKMFIKR